MDAPQSIWQIAMDVIVNASKSLPPVWPPELPPENTPDFWFMACKLEMSTRDSVSAKLRTLSSGAEAPDPTPLEAWFFRRRFEWAGQVMLAKVQEQIEPDATLAEVLEWLLVRSWETDGCIAMWNHAERGGRAHPGNPDGLSPLL